MVMVMWGWVGNSDEALAVVRCNSGDANSGGAIAAGPWDDSGEAIAMKQIAVMQIAVMQTAAGPLDYSDEAISVMP